MTKADEGGRGIVSTPTGQPQPRVQPRFLVAVFPVFAVSWFLCFWLYCFGVKMALGKWPSSMLDSEPNTQFFNIAGPALGYWLFGLIFLFPVWLIGTVIFAVKKSSHGDRGYVFVSLIIAILCALFFLADPTGLIDWYLD